MKRGQRRGFPTGRKRIANHIKYSVGFDPSTWEELCEIARRRNHTVAHAIRLLVEYGLEEQDSIGWLNQDDKRPWELTASEAKERKDERRKARRLHGRQL